MAEPTATQVVAVAHETPASAVEPLPLRFGVLCTDHFAPSQRTPSVAVPSLDEKRPTAAQAEGDGHETAASRCFVAPVGLGDTSVDHVVPFQRLMKAPPVEGVWPMMEKLPTATQKVLVAQETARSAPMSVAGGRGTV